VDHVGLDDNFFDLGGHSLLVARVHARLREDLKVEVSMVDLFQFPTIATLTAHIMRDEEAEPRFQHLRDRVARQKQAIQRQAVRNA
jgi:acyl carrier protein